MVLPWVEAGAAKARRHRHPYGPLAEALQGCVFDHEGRLMIVAAVAPQSDRAPRAGEAHTLGAYAHRAQAMPPEGALWASDHYVFLPLRSVQQAAVQRYGAYQFQLQDTDPAQPRRLPIPP